MSFMSITKRNCTMLYGILQNQEIGLLRTQYKIQKEQKIYSIHSSVQRSDGFALRDRDSYIAHGIGAWSRRDEIVAATVGGDGTLA